MRVPFLMLWCVSLWAAPGLFDWGWQAPLANPAVWHAQPGWLSNVDATATVTVDGEALRFAVPTPGRGMKWSLAGVNAAIADAPYLVLEYRATGLNTASTDYFVYLDDKGKRETRAIQLDALVADGEWHTLARDLREVAESDAFAAIAIQVQAAADTPATVWVRNLRQVENPPAPLAATPAQDQPDALLPLAAATWVARPTWLSNPDESPTATVADGVAKLSVTQAGKGMKWSWFLPEEMPLTGHRFLSLRYRGTGLSGQSDYALCVLGTATEAGRDYTPVLSPAALVTDGRWHVAQVELAAVAKQFPRIKGVALQVQALAADATLEISEIGLVAARPQERASDWFAGEKVARDDGLVPLPLPAEGRATMTELLAVAQVTDWPTGSHAWYGIPFSLVGGDTPIPATGVTERAEVALPVGQACSQVFALTIAVLRGAEEEVYARNAKLVEIREIDRFRARLEYADGSREECQPWNVTHGDFVVRDGAQVLAVFADPSKVLARLVLTDNSPGMGLGITALTACTGPALFPDPDASLPNLLRRPLQKRSLKPTASVVDEVATVRLPLGTAVLPLSPLPRLTVLQNEVVNDSLQRQDGPGLPLFRVRVDGEPVAMENFHLVEARSHDTQDAQQLRLRYACTAPVPLTLTMRLNPSDQSEIGFVGITLTNEAEAEHRLAIEGPFVGPLKVGENLADIYYLYPREGACLSNRDTYRRDRFGGRFPVQFMVAFNPVANSGVYVRTEGQQEMRDYAFTKNGDGVSFAVHYVFDTPTAPGKSVTLPNAYLGLSEGDWHRAFAAYQRWLAGRYQPIAQAEQWFREVFNFRQRFLHAHDPLYDTANGRYHLEDALTEGQEQFGGIEYLHIFDWGNVPGVGRVYGRTGDTSPFDGTLQGGIPAFRQAIQGIQRRGVHVGLYIEGYLLEERGKLGQEHGAEWQIIRQNGERFYWPGSSEMMICPAVSAWRDIQLSTYESRVKELGVDGMYMDQFGFANEQKDCWSKEHGHPVPSGTTEAEFQFTRLMRQRLSAIRPNVVLYDEEIPCDVNSLNLDGSFSYHMAHCRQSRPLVPLNVPRFTYPMFKVFEILVCDRPMGGWAEGVQWTFFNGEGLWLEGPAATWFRPETLATIRQCHAILREQRDAFTSMNVEPLVETGVPGIFANVFRKGPKTVYTLYNARHRSFQGTILGPRWQNFLRAQDLWNGREIVPEQDGMMTRLPVDLPPRGVGCLLLVR